MLLIDGVLLGGLLVSALRGYQIGFLHQACSSLGFALGIVAGSRISNPLVQALPIENSVAPSIMLAIMLLLGTVGVLAGEKLAAKLKHFVHGAHTKRLDATGGVVAAAASFMVGVWLMGMIVALAPASSFQQQLGDSQILRSTDRTMPSPTQFLSELNSFIGDVATPDVFVGQEPSPDARLPVPALSELATASLRARGTIVRVEGIGCGGLMSGTGFFISPHHIVTNAHVVAGLAHPKISLLSQIMNTSLVSFDPTNDIAVLYAETPQHTWLEFAAKPATPGDAVLIVGYPKGGERHSQTGNITSVVNALSKDIYETNTSLRKVLSVQSTIVQGNSGGPVIDKEGRVVGVVFATSTTYNNIGYAVEIGSLKNQLAAAVGKTKPIGTKPCLQK